MFGSEFKRAVHATIERIFKASGRDFSRLEVLWHGGQRVGVQFKAGLPVLNRVGKYVSSIDATILLPNVNDAGVIPDAKLPLFIGYIIHELGHVWHTDNAPWDAWRHDPFISRIINGLEDPRIERCVIDEGYLSNARSLLEGVTNHMLLKTNCSPYVDPNDLQNLAFQLAIEGRRLNGYRLVAASVVHQSIYREPLEWALTAARSAKSTAEIVAIAVEFAERVRQISEQQQGDDQGEQGDDQGEQGDDQGDDQNGDQGDQDGDDQGDQDGEQGDDSDGEQQDGDQEGEKDGDEQDGGEQDGGEQDGGEQESESSTKKKGGGEPRDIEPDGSEILAEHVSEVDKGDTPRPVIFKTKTYNFKWK